MYNDDCSYKGFRIILYPNEDQKKLIHQYFGASRFVYNLGIDLEKEKYKLDGGFLNKIELDSEFTKIRKKKGFRWLNKFETSSLRFILHDVVLAYNNFFKKISRYPRYKKKKKAKQMMAIRNDRMYIGKNSVTLPGGLGTMPCGNLPSDYVIGKSNKNTKDSRPVRNYYKVRLIFDGVNYVLSFGIPISEDNNISVVGKYDTESSPKSNPIGIDVGFGHKKNNWIVDSNGIRVSKPDNSKEHKKIRHLQRKYARQLKEQSRTKIDSAHEQTKNQTKTLIKINKYYQRCTAKKMAAIHDYVNHEIIAKNPEYVVIEDLKIADMYLTDKEIPEKGRRKFNSLLNDAMMGTILSTIKYKCSAVNIPVIIAHDGFESTQICSRCGSIHHMGRKRMYACPNCGLVIDRDLNSAINLSKYAIV